MQHMYAFTVAENYLPKYHCHVDSITKRDGHDDLINLLNIYIYITAMHLSVVLVNMISTQLNGDLTRISHFGNKFQENF